jgi:adenine-specific DNA-methyltransferase
VTSAEVPTEGTSRARCGPWPRVQPSTTLGRRGRSVGLRAEPPERHTDRSAVSALLARQKEIDASIVRAADVEFLYDRPYADPGRVRVAGPFTVESLSPHRGVPEADIGEEIEAFEGRRRRDLGSALATDFAAMVLENLRAAGVQGRDLQDRVRFTALQPWPGKWIGGEGRYLEGPETAQVERRAAIFIGPEFGTLSRPDLVAAAREAQDCRFDLLVACAFSYDAHASELTRLGPVPILQAKMNPDLHMADDLKTTGKGNLFVVFGEPDIDIERLGGDMLQVRVKGVDVFDPNTGEVRSNDTKGIAAWFIDTDYDEESFFVRHAYFLGAGDPYKSLRTALQAEIDADAWGTLYRDTSRPFARPRDRADRGEGDQSLRRRGDEGVRGVRERFARCALRAEPRSVPCRVSGQLCTSAWSKLQENIRFRRPPGR